METLNFVKEELKKDHESVGTDTLTNFQFMIRNFLLPETEDTFLSLVCHLLLGRTGIRYLKNYMNFDFTKKFLFLQNPILEEQKH